MNHAAPSYHGYRFPPEVLSHAVWLYHRFCLSFRDTDDLLGQRRGRIVATNRCLGRLRAFCNWAVVSGYVETTPFKKGGVNVIRLFKATRTCSAMRSGAKSRASRRRGRICGCIFLRPSGDAAG